MKFPRLTLVARAATKAAAHAAERADNHAATLLDGWVDAWLDGVIDPAERQEITQQVVRTRRGTARTSDCCDAAHEAADDADRGTELGLAAIRGGETERVRRLAGQLPQEAA